MTPHIACSKYERFCDFKPIRSASPEDRLMRLFYDGMCIPAPIYWCNDAPCVRGDAVQIYRVYYHWHGGVTKAVDRGDKRTRRLRVRVLALLENPQRDRVIEPALRENPRRERVLDRWFEARDSSVDILVLVPWFEYGTRTRMSTDGWLEPQTMDLNGTKKLRNISRLNLFSDTISYYFSFVYLSKRLPYVQNVCLFCITTE